VPIEGERRDTQQASLQRGTEYQFFASKAAVFAIVSRPCGGMLYNNLIIESINYCKTLEELGDSALHAVAFDQRRSGGKRQFSEFGPTEVGQSRS
jgi:hypothetical protein